MEVGTIWTNTGLLKLSHKVAEGKQLIITHAAIGDGGKDDGTGGYTPSMAQTALVNERYRAEIVAGMVDSKDKHKVYFAFTIPPQIGGFYIHEAGLFDEDGDMIMITAVPTSYKTIADEGAVSELKLKIGTIFSNAEQVKLEINPSMAYVDFEDLAAGLQQVKDYSDNQLKKHAEDTTLHLTADQSQSWDGMGQRIDGHIDNNEIHVTPAEKAAWNTKASVTDKRTTFNDDGSITEMMGTTTTTTVFNADGSITETTIDIAAKIERIIVTRFEDDEIIEEVTINELG